jgi:hypothetical protein
MLATRIGLLALAVGCGSSSPDEPLPGASAAVSASTAEPDAPPSQLVRVKGISMSLPASYVPLEAQRQERLRAAALAREPSSTVTLDARRAPGRMLDGSAYVLRIELPKNPPFLRGTARDVLRRAEAELRLEMKLQGTSERHWEATYASDRLEVLARTTMSEGAQSAVLEMRTVAFLTPDDRIVMVGAQCVAASSTLCEPLLRRAAVEDEPRRRFDDVVGPAEEPIRTAAGFELGSTKADFASTCRRAGHAVDRFDWTKEAAFVRELVEGGKLSRCSGGAGPWEGGAVAAVEAHFEGDQLARLGVASTLDQDALLARLVEKLTHDYVLPEPRVVFVDLLAEGSSLYGLEIRPFGIELPSKQRPASVAFYVSRSAFDSWGR